MVAAFIVAGAFFVTQRPSETPDRFRTTMNLSVPSPDPDSDVAATDVPDVVLRAQEAVALDDATRQAALEATPPGDAGASFAASLNESGSVLSLTVTSGDRDVAQDVAGSYAGAVIEARRQLVADDIENRQQGLVSSIEDLRSRLATVEADLRARFGKLPPVAPAPESQDGEASGPPVILFSPGQNLDTTLLLFERNSLYSRLTEAQFEYAEFAVDSEAPGGYAEVIGDNTSRITSDTSKSLVAPIAGILFAGLAIGLGGAILADRVDHTIRNADGAARALSAPLLAKIPVRRRGGGEMTVLLDPDSSRADAFRDLAATSVATDRLPKAIMVTTPRGDVHGDVAANFAAALADLGVTVALVATSPTQEWFLEPFEPAEYGSATLPELLAEAHIGRLNGQVRAQLVTKDQTPNLMLLPPGEDADLDVPLDGLPPLLQALSDSGIDVVVIAGPALLDDANATIVAWATRTVLWAIQAGDITRDEASAAAARLELAGVNAFGVAMVGAEVQHSHGRSRRGASVRAGRRGRRRPGVDAPGHGQIDEEAPDAPEEAPDPELQPDPEAPEEAPDPELQPDPEAPEEAPDPELQPDPEAPEEAPDPELQPDPEAPEEAPDPELRPGPDAEQDSEPVTQPDVDILAEEQFPEPDPSRSPSLWTRVSQRPRDRR